MPNFNINHSLKLKSFEKQQKAINKAIKDYVKSSDSNLQDLIDKATSPGKNIRSSLLLATAGEANINKDVIAACASIEILHLASLVHDDDLDNAQTRRGEPTIYAEAGHEKTLLVGDMLFACAHQAAADAGHEVAKIMALGCRQMCEGQFLEQSDTYNQKRTIASYEQAVVGKTSSLIIAAVRAGAVFSELEGAEKALDMYGKHFGLAFQQLDDTLDFLSTKDQLGKPVHQDLKQGVYTLPVLHLLANAHSANIIKPYLEIAKNLQFDHDKLADDVAGAGGFKASLKEIKANIEMAQKSLKGIEGLGGLAALPVDFLDWAIKNQVAKEHKTKLA